MREEIVEKKRMNHFIRQFNRLIFNRFSLLLSGYRYSPWSIIVHEGRKTGRIYSTPIVAVSAEDSFFIPLPYGDDVDWLQNVLSKGSCKIKINGKWFIAWDPQVINSDDALSAFPTVLQMVFRIKKIEKYLTSKNKTR